MISATEAKKISDDYNNEAFTREIDYFDGKIREAAGIGKKLIKENSISSLARKFLEDNGYNVKGMVDNGGNSIVVISW